jgi:hypothetical protein
VQLHGSPTVLGLDHRYRNLSLAPYLPSQADFGNPTYLQTLMSSTARISGTRFPDSVVEATQPTTTRSIPEDSKMRLHPSPHRIRRNFSLFPFANPFPAKPFADNPEAAALVPHRLYVRHHHDTGECRLHGRRPQWGFHWFPRLPQRYRCELVFRWIGAQGIVLKCPALATSAGSIADHHSPTSLSSDTVEGLKPVGT